MPYDSKADNNTAAVAEVGMPKVNNGINTPAAAALFAASGPATPSIAPFPNSSGFLLSFFLCNNLIKLELLRLQLAMHQ